MDDLMLVMYAGKDRKAMVASEHDLEQIASHGWATPVTADLLNRIVGMAQMFRYEQASRTAPAQPPVIYTDLFVDTGEREPARPERETVRTEQQTSRV